MAKKTTARRSARTGAKPRGSWVRKVAERSDAMDLPRGIFKGSPAAIARGLKRSALRTGRSLSGAERRRLERCRVLGDRGAPRLRRGASERRGVWGAMSGPPTF